MNAQFQRRAKRDKKAFLHGQLKETEENNRMEKTKSRSKQSGKQHPDLERKQTRVHQNLSKTNRKLGALINFRVVLFNIFFVPGPIPGGKNLQINKIYLFLKEFTNHCINPLTTKNDVQSMY